MLYMSASVHARLVMAMQPVIWNVLKGQCVFDRCCLRVAIFRVIFPGKELFVNPFSIEYSIGIR